MEPIVITTATHTLMLDYATGVGLAFDPNPTHDVQLGTASLHTAGWADIVDRAHLAGFEPVEADDGNAEVYGFLPHGGAVIRFAAIPDCTGDDLADYIGTMADVEAARLR